MTDFVHRQLIWNAIEKRYEFWDGEFPCTVECMKCHMPISYLPCENCGFGTGKDLDELPEYK